MQKSMPKITRSDVDFKKAQDASTKKRPHVWNYTAQELAAINAERGRLFDALKEKEYRDWLANKEKEQEEIIPIVANSTIVTSTPELSKAKKWQLEQIQKEEERRKREAAAAAEAAAADAADAAMVEYYEGMDFHGGSGSGEQFNLTPKSMENYLIELVTKSKNSKNDKVGKVMKEFKEGKLHSGKNGPVVTDEDQAMAIALSEAGKSKKDNTKSIVEELAESKFNSELEDEDKDGEGVYTIIELVNTNTKSLKDACWEGYEAVGMKTKNGKQVPNCVPKKKKKK